MNKDTLVRLLTGCGILVEQYGIGKAKTLDQLLDEINDGETELVLRRSVKVIALNVFYKDDDKELILVEQKQVLLDGRERPRTLDSSIGEKMLADEVPLEAARHALKEELEIEEMLDLKEGEPFERTSVSPSYPGLSTHYRFFRFSVYLPDHLFKPEGYIIKEADKTTYFVWKPLARA